MIKKNAIVPISNNNNNDKKIKIILGHVYVNMYHYTCEDSGVLIIFKRRFATPDHNLACQAFVG